MKSALPTYILRNVNLHDKGHWLFASGKFADKPVPKYVGTHDAIYFIGGMYYAPAHAYQAGLEAKRAAGGDPHAVDISINALAQRDLDVFDKLQSYSALSSIRDRVIREAAQRLMEKTGAEQFQVLPVVADLFDVGHRVVQRAMGLMAEAKPKSDAHKKDPRWGHLRVMVQRAKSGAYSKDMVRGPNTPASYGGFKAESLLIKSGGDLVFPERCPVLGVPLVYDRFTNPKDMRIAHIARKDTTKPLSDDNVQIVCMEARKALETRSGKARLSLEPVVREVPGPSKFDPNQELDFSYPFQPRPDPLF